MPGGRLSIIISLSWVRRIRSRVIRALCVKQGDFQMSQSKTKSNPNSWEDLSESEIEAESGEGTPVAQPSLSERNASRSRSPRPSLGGRGSEPLRDPVKFKLRLGAWWAKPLARAAVASRCGVNIRRHPTRPMVHASACSGLLMELFAAEVPSNHAGFRTLHK
jgi:hypothetical protein